jgi:hypothetical protein
LFYLARDSASKRLVRIAGRWCTFAAKPGWRASFYTFLSLKGFPHMLLLLLLLRLLLLLLLLQAL